MIKKLTLIFCLLLPVQLWAWGATGHRVIAAIAYDHLTPAAKKVVDKYSDNYSKSIDAQARFMELSAWPDFLRMRGVDTYNQWHFMGYPYTRDGVEGRRYPHKSLMWAVRFNEYQFKHNRSFRKRAKALAFVVHLFGDAHQPMHCVALYSKRFPKGDEQGLKYKLNNRKFQGLHAFWDAGGGLLTMPRIAYNKYVEKVKLLAAKLQKKYPWNQLQHQIANQNPKVWTRHSYEIAKNVAYSIPYDSKVTAAYRKKTQQASEKQLVLAGYRLAYWLNHNIKPVKALKRRNKK